MIRISKDISIDENELSESFIHADGPGGQNVNKVATAVQLRFDVAGSPNLPPPVKDRLLRLAGNRATNDGVLIVSARRFRTRERNRQDALDRLIELIRQASTIPKKRVRTKPSKAAKARRLREKHERSSIKHARRPVSGDE